MRSSETPSTDWGPRVLLLGAHAESFSAAPSWPDGFRSIRVRAACPERVARAATSYPVRRLRPVDLSARDVVRTVGAWAKSTVMAFILAQSRNAASPIVVTLVA